MFKIKVSICVPIYGVEKYIKRCAISLFEQTYDNIEYIFVNDCTKDRSIEILLETINKYPSRKYSIQIIKHKINQGLAATRNTAIEYCTGDFVLWVDSDDYIDTKTVELLINKQKKTDSDIISFDFCIYHNKYKEYCTQPQYTNPIDMANVLLARKAPISIWGRLIRLSLYKEYEIKTKEGINVGEDYQVSPILAFYAKKVSTLNQQLYHYDCTNEKAYTYVFSEEKEEQVWRSIELLEAFFKDKDSSYMNSILKAKVERISRNKIDCCKTNGHKEYFMLATKRLNNIDSKEWKALAIPERIALYIDNMKLLKIYVLFAGCIKHLFLRIKSNIFRNLK